MERRVEYWRVAKAAVQAGPPPGVPLSAAARDLCDQALAVLDELLLEEDWQPDRGSPHMAIRISLHLSLIDVPAPPDEDAQLLPYLDILRDAVRLEVEGVTAWCDAVNAEGEVVAGTESLSPRERAWRAYHYAVALLLTHATPTSGRCKGLFLHLRQGLLQGLDYPPLAHQLEKAFEEMKTAPAPLGTTVVTPSSRKTPT